MKIFGIEFKFNGFDIWHSGNFNPANKSDIGHNHVISNIDNLQTTLNSKAPLASPAFTGTPTAPTAPNGTNTNQIATTKFVQNDAQSKVDTHANVTASLSTLGHVKYAVLTATLDTSWSGSSAPYSKTVTVSGILATDTPIIDIVMSGTYSTDEARIEAWGYIYRAVTANGSITFYATEKPTVSLPIQIRVVR